MSDLQEIKCTAKINVDGRILIPSIIRRALSVKSGDIVTIQYSGDGITIHPATEETSPPQKSNS